MIGWDFRKNQTDIWEFFNFNGKFARRPKSVNDYSSDGIQFVNSDGEVVELDDEESDSNFDPSNDGRSTTSYVKSPRHEVQIMYIQMEFCEKSTLR